MSDVLVKDYLVLLLLSGHTDIHAHQTDCATCGRDGTGSAILAGSGHGSVCQTRHLTYFWVLTCAYIMVFLRS